MKRKTTRIFEVIVNCLILAAMLLGMIIGGYEGYAMFGQKALTSDEIHRMYETAKNVNEYGVKKLSPKIKDEFIIIVEQEKVIVSTLDNTKGRLQVDFSNGEDRYEITYKYAKPYCLFEIFAFCIAGGVCGFGIMLVFIIIISFIFEKISNMLKHIKN